MSSKCMPSNLSKYIIIVKISLDNFAIMDKKLLFANNNKYMKYKERCKRWVEHLSSVPAVLLVLL